MKKILTVSLMAMMVVGAARADIASVGYVDEKLATKANASDVTSINAKIGDVAAGKTLAGMIADAKQEAIDAAGEAAYDDTAVRGLIAAKEDSSNKVTSVSDDWSEEEKQQYYPSVFLTEDMIQSSTNALGALANQNKTAIQNINNSAVMKSGITADKVAVYDAYGAKITANETAAAGAQAAAEAAQGAADAAQDAADANATAIAAINNSENGLLKQAETAAKSYADSLADNYDAAGSAATALTDAKSYADGVAATAKSEAIEAAKTAGDAAYDAKGAAATAKSEAITAAKSAGDAAYAAKSYEGRVQANETAIAAIVQARIQKEGAGDGTYALTMKVIDGVSTFQWDKIGY